MYIKTKLSAFLGIFMSTLICATSDADYKEIFDKLFVSNDSDGMYRELLLKKPFIDSIENKIMSTLKDPRTTLSKELSNYKETRRSLAEDFTDNTNTLVRNIMKKIEKICENFKQNIDQGKIVTQEEFKQALKSICQLKSTLGFKSFKDLELKVNKERDKIGSIVDALQDEKEKDLSKQLYHRIDMNELEKTNICFAELAMKNRTEESKLRSKINEIRYKISEIDPKGNKKEEIPENLIEDLKKEKQQLEKAKLEEVMLMLNQISENKKSTFIQKFLNFFSWIFSLPFSFFTKD